jgi:hypothetical protein
MRRAMRRIAAFSAFMVERIVQHDAEWMVGAGLLNHNQILSGQLRASACGHAVPHIARRPAPPRRKRSQPQGFTRNF